MALLDGLSCVLSIALLGSSLGLVGCRNCGEAGREGPPEASGPTMPTGMLAPWSDAPPSPPATSPAERLSLARGRSGGEWAELQVAGADDRPDRAAFERWKAGSRFLSLDAMTLLHEPFARALPGFDLFLPRLFDGAALGRLRAELAASKTQVAAIPNVAAAKARWGEASPLIGGLPDDLAWISARTALLGTIDELSDLAVELGKKGQGLWVLGI